MNIDIHAASIRAASLTRYLSEAHALEAYEVENDWRLKTALEEFAAVADALGYKLVEQTDIEGGR